MEQVAIFIRTPDFGSYTFRFAHSLILRVAVRLGEPMFLDGF